MRSPYIQQGFGISPRQKDGTTMTDLIDFVKHHLVIKSDVGNVLGLHPNFVQAAFPVLCEVVDSDTFLNSAAMSFYMKTDILHGLIRTLVQDTGLTPAFLD